MPTPAISPARLINLTIYAIIIVVLLSTKYAAPPTCKTEYHVITLCASNSVRVELELVNSQERCAVCWLRLLSLSSPSQMGYLLV